MSNNLILVEIIDRYGAENILFHFDVDLTLRNTMCRNTPDDQHALMGELYERTAGGIIVMSGRSREGIDLTLRGQFPASFEHHSAMRIEKGGEVISLAPKIDTQKIAERARALIGERIDVVDTAQAVRDSEGHFSVVYPEVKDYAVALVHSLGHSQVARDKEILKEIAEQILIDMNISATHKVAVGSDAVEIVPKSLAPDSIARQILAPAQIKLLDGALNKGVAVHNFMSLKAFSGRKPFVVGDSGTDGVAMNEAKKFGGGGVWVLNDRPVPDDFRDAVNGYQIKNFLNTWEHIHAAVEVLRGRAMLMKIMPKAGVSELIVVPPRSAPSP